MLALILLFAASTATTSVEVGYTEGLRLAGGSIAEALVEKCDAIDDEYLNYITDRKDKRRAILRCIRGKIGPLEYVNQKYEQMASGGGGKSSAFGSVIKDGDKRGPKTFPPEGKYITRTPPKFSAALKAWTKAGSEGSDKACVELAAAAFCEAVSVKSGNVAEKKIVDFLKYASSNKNANAAFLLAVCYYYGIGCEVKRKSAFAQLKKWKEYSGTTKATRGGWVHRRFEEMKK